MPSMRGAVGRFPNTVTPIPTILPRMPIPSVGDSHAFDAAPVYGHDAAVPAMLPSLRCCRPRMRLRFPKMMSRSFLARNIALWSTCRREFQGNPSDSRR